MTKQTKAETTVTNQISTKEVLAIAYNNYRQTTKKPMTPSEYAINLKTTLAKNNIEFKALAKAAYLISKINKEIAPTEIQQLEEQLKKQQEEIAKLKKQLEQTTKKPTVKVAKTEAPKAPAKTTKKGGDK